MELRLASWLAFIKTLFIKVLLKNQAGQNVVITRPLWLFAASPRYGHVLSGGKAIHSEEKFRWCSSSPRGRNWRDLTVKRLTRGPLVACFWLQKRPASQLNLAPGRTSQLVTWAVENASDKIIWCFGRTTHVVRSLQVRSHVAYHFPPRSVSSSSTTLFLAGGPNYPTSTEASRCQSCMVPFSAPST